MASAGLARHHGPIVDRIARLVLLTLGITGGIPSAMALPPHHTDDGFENVPVVDRAGLHVTLPFFVRMAAAHWWRDTSGVPGLVANDGTFLRDNARHSVPTATWIGHATVLVQMDHVTFLTDPTWSDRASPVGFAGPQRFVPPGVALADLPPIDFVVVSHSHYDHLDLPTLQALTNGRTRFLVPLRLGPLLRDAGIGPVEELDWWDTTRVGPVTVHCVPAQHWSQRGLFDHNETLWSGWVVAGPTRRFYFAGDTGYFAGFAEIGARLGPITLAALPIGAYDPPAMMRPFHLDPEEAVRAAHDLGAAHVLGIHYGTFELTEEPLDEPPRRLHVEGARQGLAPERLWTPPVGEIRQW